MKIYDCFTFYNELDLLEIRMAEIYDVVDVIVIVEAAHCFRGKPKPLIFLENQARFSRYAAKIRHVIVEDMPLETPDNWQREYHQRNAIERGVGDADPDDWIIVSDVDEIPRAEAIASLRTSTYRVVGFHMSLSYFKINYMAVGIQAESVTAIACRASVCRRGQVIRDWRVAIDSNSLGRENPGKIGHIRHAGWHFSYMGDEDFVASKLSSTCHTELNPEQYIATLDIEALMRSGRDLYGREGFTWAIVPVTGYFPKTIRADSERYAMYMAPWGAEPTDETKPVTFACLDAIPQRRSAFSVALKRLRKRLRAAFKRRN